LGYEAAGIVEAVGRNVSNVKVGDRVAFADSPRANAELVAVPSENIIPLPQDISFEHAAAILLQGLTAHYLTHDSFVVHAGTLALVHAAAGGVGQLLCQIISYEGGTAIGLTSSPSKKEIALQHGAAEVFLYDQDWESRVLQFTNNIGVDVVYESIGSTLMESFAATKPRGTVVFFGFAGGNPPQIDPRMLMDASKSLVGGDLWNYLTSREERIRRSSELSAMLRGGHISANIGKMFPLRDGKAAHEYLESRMSAGKILMIP
jgi:NADPH2:quinone reductase